MNSYLLTLKPVWDNAKYCSIDHKKIEEVARLLIEEESLMAPQWRESVFPQEDSPQFIEFIGVANALNFCFIDRVSGKKFDAEYPRGSGEVWRGSYGMIACLKRALDEGMPILDPRFIAHISKRTVKSIFEPAHTPMPLLEKRVLYLRNIGRRLLENDYSGFTQLFEESNFYLFNAGNGIVEKVIKLFESYRDEVIWKGRYHLVFAKRALLLPMIYYGRVASASPGGALTQIRDPGFFGPICDYVVPNALRILGILKYADPLAKKIASEKELFFGSDEEVEIRAISALAVSLLLQEINRQSPPGRWYLLPELDSYLWRFGRQKGDFKHHHTYCTAY